MSVKVMDRVWELSQSKGAARLVLLALADWADDEGFCYPSLTAIVRKTQLTRPGVVQVLRRLEQLGELETTVRGHDTRDKVKARTVARGGWQPTNYYRIQVGNAVYYQRKPQVVNGVNQQVVNPVSEGSQQGFAEVVNAIENQGGPSLNDPSVLEPSIEPSGGERVADATLRSPEELVEVWNASRFPGPLVEQLNPKRLTRYRQALAATCRREDWTTAVRWLNRQAFANAPGSGQHPTWRASLDWLTKPGKLAEILESAKTDAAAPPQRPGRAERAPTESLSPDDQVARLATAERRREASQREEQLLDEASRLVLELSDRARRPLELAALEELEPFRERLSPATFDDSVCRALPKKLLARAGGRPLADVVAELERQAAAA